MGSLNIISNIILYSHQRTSVLKQRSDRVVVVAVDEDTKLNTWLLKRQYSSFGPVIRLLTAYILVLFRPRQLGQNTRFTKLCVQYE